jgi:hypothetical protein
MIKTFIIRLLIGNSGANEELDRDFLSAELRGGKIRIRNQSLTFFQKKRWEEKVYGKTERSGRGDESYQTVW